MQLIAGIDEAGRGPLAGPVVASAVILDTTKPISGLKDSKLLSEKKRNELSILIKENSICYAFGSASVEEIDQINILQASLLAMKRAFENLKIQPAFALIDGNFCPNISCVSKAIIDGDNIVPAISAASIIAKVERDQQMIKLDSKYPEYGFAKHKGYGTKQHIEAIQRFGITPIHRLSFTPVKEMISQDE